ncbi:hypothetical protein [Funiculus sociatus]|uniref:hypothetical protein n=1 Tax=Funiculus sociatus TaxID=450527 RepID=UPI0032998749
MRSSLFLRVPQKGASLAKLERSHFLQHSRELLCDRMERNLNAIRQNMSSR